MASPASSSRSSDIPLLVTDRQVERVLEAVGARLVPVDLDRNGLAADLSRAALRYGVRRLFQQPPREEVVRARLQRLEKAIDKLWKELPTTSSRLDWEILNILDNEETASYGSMAKFCTDVLWLKALAARVLDQEKAVITPFAKEPWGAEYWLFGEELPPIFERHFRRRAGRSRPPHPGTPAVGPYIRFAKAVANLFGVRKSTGQPYGAETITKALYEYQRVGKTERDPG